MKFHKVTPSIASLINLKCKEGCECCSDAEHKLALFWARDGANGKANEHVKLTTIAGYKFFRMNGGFVSVHKLVWLKLKGKFTPNCHIDHIDGDRFNFQPHNLREISIQENMQNRRKPRRADAVGSGLPKGVQLTPSGKFKASISENGKTKHLGTFESAELAHMAWRNAAVVLHGEFMCDRV